MAEQTESSIHIDADPATIMDIIADVASYPDWTTYSSAEVLEEFDNGRPALARFELTSPLKDVQVMKYEWTGADHVDWHLVEGQLTKSVHGTYHLTAEDSGGTTVLYKLAVDTRLPMIGALRRKAEKVVIDTALKGLKQRVEG